MAQQLKILNDNTRLLMSIDLRGIKKVLMKIQLNKNETWSFEILELQITTNESPQIHVFILHTMRYIRPKIDKKNFKFVYDGEQRVDGPRATLNCCCQHVV
jgi:hypothetical protein